MAWFTTIPGLNSDHVINGFAWGELGDATVVDVGGSYGSLSIAIAKRFPGLRCIVQDQPEVVASAREKVPAYLKDRVKFMEHDFFTEQPVKGAQVYLLRWILHDWSDTYAARILKALVPALRVGSKLVICEVILPEPGTLSNYEEKGLR